MADVVEKAEYSIYLQSQQKLQGIRRFIYSYYNFPTPITQRENISNKATRPDRLIRDFFEDNSN